MPQLHTKLSPVKRNLLCDLEATESEENYSELVPSLTICNTARVHPDDVPSPDSHQQDKDVNWRKILTLSSVSSKNRASSISTERDDDSYMCPSEMSKTLMEAMKELHLDSASRPVSSESVDPSNACSTVQRETGVVPIAKTTDDHPDKKTEKCIHLVLGRVGMRINSSTVVKKQPVLLDAKSMIIEDTSITQEHEKTGVAPIAKTTEDHPDKRTEKCIHLVVGRAGMRINSSTVEKNKSVLSDTKSMVVEDTSVTQEREKHPSSYMAKQTQFATGEEPLPICESTCSDGTSRLPVRESSQASGRERHLVDRACRSSKFRRGSGHFVSMAESIRKFQTTTPKRFHTTARTAVSRRAKNRSSARACTPCRTKTANTSKNARNAEEASRATLKAGTLHPPTIVIEENQDGDCSVGACKSLTSYNSAARRLSPAMRARRQLPPQLANATVTRPRHLPGDRKSDAPADSERGIQCRQILRRKEKEAENMHRTVERQKREIENREIREGKRTLIIRARPMPVFKPPVIVKSTKPLTVPHSPAWYRKKNSNM